MKINFSVKIGSLRLANPVTVASGTFYYTKRFFSPQEIKKLGALVPKTVTLQPREGNPLPRVVETPAGFLNAIGLQNPGADVFISSVLPDLAKINVPIIASIAGFSDEEFVTLTKKFHKAVGVKALELNLSCPNVHSKVLVSQSPRATFRVIKKVKKYSKVPIIVKLTPNVTDIGTIARSAENAGADAISLINSVPGFAIDIKKRRPMLGNFTGGLSGPAIKPIALYCVHRVFQSVKIPIIGMGGIMTAEDAVEFILAGATMVAVGSASFINPKVPWEVLEGIKAYMRKYRIRDIRALVGGIGV